MITVVKKGFKTKKKRDEAKKKMEVLKEEAEKEQEEFNKHWKDLGKLIDNDKEINQFINQEECVEVAEDSEKKEIALLHKKVARSA